MQTITHAAPCRPVQAPRQAASAHTTPTFRSAFDWADQVPNLDVRAAAVLNALARYAYTKDTCWPSTVAIARAARIDRETVTRHLAKLASAGLIEDTGERTGRLRNVTVWRLNWRGAMPAAGTIAAAMGDDLGDDDTPPAAHPLPPVAACPIEISPQGAELQWPELVLHQDATPALPQAEEVPQEVQFFSSLHSEEEQKEVDVVAGTPKPEDNKAKKATPIPSPASVAKPRAVTPTMAAHAAAQASDWRTALKQPATPAPQAVRDLIARLKRPTLH